MFTEVKLKNGKGTHYGLGVEVGERDGHRDPSSTAAKSQDLSPTTKFWSTTALPSCAHQSHGGRRRRDRAAWPLRRCRRYSTTPAEKQALQIYRGLQKGNIDRSLLAPNLSDYFDTQTVADFHDSLAPLGEPLTLPPDARDLRGGMTFRAFRIVYPGRRLRLTTYTYPDGKLEQYLVDPAD